LVIAHLLEMELLKVTEPLNENNVG